MRPPPRHSGLSYHWGLRTPRSRMRRVRTSLERADFGVEKIQSSAFSKEPMVGRAWEATPGKRKREAPDARHPGDQPRWRPLAEGKTPLPPGRDGPFSTLSDFHLLMPTSATPPGTTRPHLSQSSAAKGARSAAHRGAEDSQNRSYRCAMVSGFLAHSVLIGGEILAGHPFLAHGKGPAALQLLGALQGSLLGGKHVIGLRQDRGRQEGGKHERDKTDSAKKHGWLNPKVWVEWYVDRPHREGLAANQRHAKPAQTGCTRRKPAQCSANHLS